MAELDDIVGRMTKKLDDLGIAENTIVVFSSDNGGEIFSWPDGGMHPFKGEKGTTWEGGLTRSGVSDRCGLRPVDWTLRTRLPYSIRRFSLVMQTA